jgi:hypothetical protein
MPITRLNVRCKWKTLTPACDASSASFRCLAFSLVEQTTDALHEIDLRIENRGRVLAGNAGRRESLLAPRLRQVEEADAFAMRATRRARRATVTPVELTAKTN